MLEDRLCFDCVTDVLLCSRLGFPVREQWRREKIQISSHKIKSFEMANTRGKGKKNTGGKAQAGTTKTTANNMALANAKEAKAVSKEVAGEAKYFVVWSEELGMAHIFSDAGTAFKFMEDHPNSSYDVFEKPEEAMMAKSKHDKQVVIKVEDSPPSDGKVALLKKTPVCLCYAIYCVLLCI